MIKKQSYSASLLFFPIPDPRSKKAPPRAGSPQEKLAFQTRERRLSNQQSLMPKIDVRRYGDRLRINDRKGLTFEQRSSWRTRAISPFMTDRPGQYFDYFLGQWMDEPSG